MQVDMKLLWQQLQMGENQFCFDAPKDKWLYELQQKFEEQGYSLLEGLRTEFVLERLDNDCILSGNLLAVVQLNCARCIESFNFNVNHAFTLAITQSPSHRRSKKQSKLHPDEAVQLDVYFLEGPELDLVPIVREQFYLSLPYQAICGTNCLGLCQICGANLNQGACGCSKTHPVGPITQAFVKGLH